ncbi:MAG TPA: alkaline phosphatase family protein [Kofleriaceae bacterium]|nr:alkaline phosphatase family protein [Kofleriaceae bacterium]
MMKRRDALKTIGGLAGAAGMARFLPGCDGGDDGPVGITNYVYLMLENRTYDHVLGARAMEGLGGDGLRAGMTNPDMNGNPVGLFIPDALSECALDPPHEWDPSHASWNNGAMDGFLKAHQLRHASTGAKEPMQYLTRAQIPVTWALADAYTTCDRWFASVMGPTFPNRSYWHTGTSFGLDNNTAILARFSDGLPGPSIYNRLDDAAVDWAFYYGSYAVAGLLGKQGPYQLDLGPDDGTGRLRRFGDPQFGTGQFFRDAAAGKLPTVVYIDPTFDQNDDHPPVHPILAQQLIASIYIALAKSPQWKNTLFVITYDEHGGFFDHVSPPQTTDDTLAKYGVPGFQQLGFRVPALVMGPYAKQGYVSSVQYDHTSALKHLQSTFGLESLTPRVDAANDLSDCIDMERLARGEPAAPIELPEINVDDWPYNDAGCHGGPSFHKGPLHEWLDANPGKWDPAYDIRGTDPEQRVIRDFLRQHQARRRR